MRLWDESKHPRDNYGKFRKVGIMEGMGENDIDESEENFGERKDGLTLGKGKTTPAPVQKFKPIENMESLRGAPMTHEEANSGKVNPNFGKYGYNGNCQACVATYYARRLGYNVEALPYTPNNDTIKDLAANPCLAYIKDGNLPKMRPAYGKNKMATISSQMTNGDIGLIEYKTNPNDYHVIIIEKVNDNIYLYDPQINSKTSKEVINNNGSVRFVNLKGYDINKEICREVMKNGKR